MKISFCRIVFVFILLCLLSCSTVPRQRGSGSLLVISALLPGSSDAYVNTQKLVLFPKKEGAIDTSVIYYTDDVRGDLFFAYNMPEGCYVVAGAVMEVPAGDTADKVIFIFRHHSAMRCTVCVEEKTVSFGGRLQFHHQPYDSRIADDFQKEVLNRYNPLIITGDAYTLNSLIFNYSLFMCNTAFLETGNRSSVLQRIDDDILDSGWKNFLPQSEREEKTPSKQ